MNKGRLEAFSDGVIAIIIAIMVLEIKVPHGADLSVLEPLLAVFLSYVLSFFYVGIYWNNHHHTMQVAEKVNGTVLWGNLHLLFWLSLLPFTSGWMGENHFALWPVVLYGLNLFLCAVAYMVWSQFLVGYHGAESNIAKALSHKGNVKGKISLVGYVMGMALAFVNPWLGFMCYVAVAMIWLIPDRRMERIVGMNTSQKSE